MLIVAVADWIYLSPQSHFIHTVCQQLAQLVEISISDCLIVTFIKLNLKLLPAIRNCANQISAFLKLINLFFFVYRLSRKGLSQILYYNYFA